MKMKDLTLKLKKLEEDNDLLYKEI